MTENLLKEDKWIKSKLEEVRGTWDKTFGGGFFGLRDDFMEMYCEALEAGIAEGMKRGTQKKL